LAKPAPQIVRASHPESSTTMPDLAGLSLRQALDRVCALGFDPRIVGSGRVVRQSPEPGAALSSQTTVEIVLRDGS
jgi:cell division protein FtsI (penicillin-binding protein 3)